MSVKQIHEEQELLNRIVKGNRQAFTLLFERNYPALYTFAFKLTRSKVLAEEVIQDVFLNIWLNRSGLGQVENIGGYMNRITRNLSFNALRNIAKDKVLSGGLDADENFPDHSTQESIDYKDTARLVNAAIEKLPAQQQRVYELCHKEGLTYEQAALCLNIAPSTVHSHMKAALRGIRLYFKNIGVPMAIILQIFPF